MRNALLTVLFLGVIASQAFSQHDTTSVTRYELNLSPGQQGLGIGLDDFLSRDLAILQAFPSSFKNIRDQIKTLPKEMLRLVDSIDYRLTSRDTLQVRIYSQNYAYQSSNSYKLSKTKSGNKEAAGIDKHITIDYHLKPVVSDKLTFRKEAFTTEVVETPVPGEEHSKRIILKRIQQSP